MSTQSIASPVALRPALLGPERPTIRVTYRLRQWPPSETCTWYPTEAEWQAWLTLASEAEVRSVAMLLVEMISDEEEG